MKIFWKCITLSLTLATLWQSHSATLGGERSLLLVLSTRLKKQSRIRMAVHFLFPRFFKGEQLTGDMQQDVDQRLIFKVNFPLHLYKTKNVACIPTKWIMAFFSWMSCLLKQKSCYWLWKLDIEKFILVLKKDMEENYPKKLAFCIKSYVVMHLTLLFACKGEPITVLKWKKLFPSEVCI